jgi:hypothetical protein
MWLLQLPNGATAPILLAKSTRYLLEAFSYFFYRLPLIVAKVMADSRCSPFTIWPLPEKMLAEFTWLAHSSRPTGE